MFPPKTLKLLIKMHLSKPKYLLSCQFNSIYLLSHVWPFVTPWTAAPQVSLSITNSWSLLKFMSIELVMLSNHLILCWPLLFCLQSFPASGTFLMSQFFTSDASTSVLPVKVQDWFPLGLTGWISLQSMGSQRVRHDWEGNWIELTT